MSQKNKIIVILEGGNVQSVFGMGNPDGVTLEIWDYDNWEDENAEPDEEGKSRTVDKHEFVEDPSKQEMKDAIKKFYALYTHIPIMPDDFPDADSFTKAILARNEMFDIAEKILKGN